MTNKLDKASTTSICGFDSDTINVRGKDLVNDLVGKSSFTEYWLLQALGKNPSNAQITIVDAVLVTIMEHGLVPSDMQELRVNVVNCLKELLKPAIQKAKP